MIHFHSKILFRLFLLCFWMSGTLFPCSAQPARYALREGQKLIQEGRFVEALDMMNLAIRKDPSMPDLYYLRGYAKYSLDDYLGAEQDYTAALEISPALSEVLVNRSIVRSLLMNFTGAYHDLSRAQKIDSTNVGIYISLAKLKLYLKKYYGCIGDCRTAIRLGCKDESPWLLKGTAEWSLERYEEAEADFLKALQINPANAYPYIQLGSMYLERDRIDTAVLNFTQAIRLDSNNLYAVFNRSLALIKQSNLDGALEDLNKVIRLSPYNSYAYFNRALVLYEKKDLKGAIKDLSAVIKLNPQHVTSYYYRGAMRSEMKDYQGAVGDFDQAISLYPDNPDAWMARSEAKLRLRDPAGSREDYIKAMELASKDPLRPENLSGEKKSYLESIVKMSGEFEEMNTQSSKFQNQFIDIQLRDLFQVVNGKVPFEQIRLYDTYGKQHYPSHIIAFSGQPNLLGDSVLYKQIEQAGHQIDIGRNVLSSLFTRAVAYAILQKYNLAFADYDSLIRADSLYVLAWYMRACARFGLIRLIQSLDDYQDQITIGRSNSGLRDQVITEYPEHTYSQVRDDFTMAIELDPACSFAYYNRGYISCIMGEYGKAVEDFTSALSFRENFAEALYNRGLLYLMMKETGRGCEDLSKAGELGIPDAYRVIKRYCYK